MYFLAAYDVHDDDGQFHQVLMPVEGESEEQVRSLFRQAVSHAIEAGHPGFSFAGRYHHLENFVDTVYRTTFDEYHKVTKQCGEHFELAFDNLGDEDRVFYMHYVLRVSTLEGMVLQARVKKRSLRWMPPLADCVFLLDELWDRNILLPATRTASGMAVLDDTNETFVLKPEWAFWIEGHQDDLLISAGPYVLQVLESEEGYEVLSVQQSGETPAAGTDVPEKTEPTWQ
jgi:hypothetical protein